MFIKIPMLLFFFQVILCHKDHPVTHPILQFSPSTALSFQSGPLFKDSTSLYTTSSHLKRGHPKGIFPSGFDAITMCNYARRDPLIVISYF